MKGEDDNHPKYMLAVSRRQPRAPGLTSWPCVCYPERAEGVIFVWLHMHVLYSLVVR